MSDPRPIGVFDSGVGGLTVAAALMRRLPGESILYLGDTARLPYGTKSAETVRRYTARNVAFLRGRDVKAVVVACNTASALGLDGLEADVPLWGVIEPGARAALAAGGGHIGVLATESTIRSGAYEAALGQLDPAVEVTSQACGLFVPLVEEGWSNDPVAETVARRYLAPLEAVGVDTLILGCTHYPMLAPTIASVVGPGVTLVDSAETVAEAVATAFADRRLRASGGPARHHLCVTDDGTRVRRLATAFLDRSVEIELVDVTLGRG